MTRLRTPRTFDGAFGRYVVDEVLGQGGAGEVFGGRDEDGRQIAVKVLKVGQVSTQHRRRFKNEIHFLQSTRHSNVIEIADAGALTYEGATTPFYVMPRMDENLREWWKANRNHDALLRVFSQILDGVEAAHLKGVSHRDLKPENILVRRQPLQCVVADFGAADFCEEAMLTAVETRDNERLANFAYAAPEQRVRGARVDHRADIFALGVILNEMFTGELPLGTAFKRVVEVAPQRPYVDQVVDSMISARPENRPQTVEAVKVLLQRHGAEWVALQRIGAIDRQVIPAASIDDDPLALEDVRVTDAKWDANVLTLNLSPPVNETWVHALLQGVRGWTVGEGPRDFEFLGNTARIRCGEARAQAPIEALKGWVSTARKIYRDMRTRETQRREEEAKAKLAREREEEERRVRVNRSLKW